MDLAQAPLPLPSAPGASHHGHAHALQKLRIGRLPQAPAVAAVVVAFARALFPSLCELEEAALGTALAVGCGVPIDS